ncbi:uncharacterized protein LOC106469570 isoform X2 [Limulus polyphemus]|uniref:Uncharacterized protein LOC106469570 isoform X2 n=1 Tax=Limulus polyphemus TaxID=6850 RepID=A0ABM1BNF7_LIMPO|nr:uncharacterized protein LOC106469570 isoform X2 [Limulus polyphemus]
MVWRCVTSLTVCLLMITNVDHSAGHGRLIDPPSRSSMWRYGFPTTPNYNDHELFCGGYQVHWKRNGGKCGICGDAWNDPQPRKNEAGGIYGKGIIVKKYQNGQEITAKVQLTANHKGFFEFKLCPNNNPKKVATQECLDRYPLALADGSGYKYIVPNNRPDTYKIQLRLPSGLTCTQCVFQWTYTAGNNWGTCEDGSQSVGCGPQETFRGCADVSIQGDNFEPVRPQQPQPSPPPTKRIWRPTHRPHIRHTNKPKAPLVKHPNGRRKVCYPVSVWKTVPGMDVWCINNCSGGFCPPSHCACE